MLTSRRRCSQVPGVLNETICVVLLPQLVEGGGFASVMEQLFKEGFKLVQLTSVCLSPEQASKYLRMRTPSGTAPPAATLLANKVRQLAGCKGLHWRYQRVIDVRR